MVVSDQITCVIAAGGRSSRFGEDKAGILIDGRPLIEQIVKAAEQVAAEVWVGLPPKADDESPIRRVLRRDRCVIVDDPSGCGPIGSLRAGLRAVKTPWMLFLSCDLPGIEGGHLNALADRTREGADVIVAVGPEGRRHPLIALYRTSVEPVVSRAVDEGRWALMGVLDSVNCLEVHLPGRALLNMNSPKSL